MEIKDVHFRNTLLLLLTFFASRSFSEAGDWIPAAATFYGGNGGSEGMGGACGYGSMYSEGYGIKNTALSTALFNDGAACGMCFQIVCDSSKSKWCKKTVPYITVTATNFCPPNYNIPSDAGGWCNPPRKHFDMSQPAWETIAVYQAGIVPVYYRRVRCGRNGGLRFTINGNNYFLLVLVSNVGGSGVVTRVWVKGTNTNWMDMRRNWGMNWEASTTLNGQSISFRVQTDDGRIRTAYDVTPSSWSFGRTYQTSVQF